MRDIFSRLGRSDIARIKIGVANERLDVMDTADFVLSKFSGDELSFLDREIFDEVEKVLNKALEE